MLTILGCPPDPGFAAKAAFDFSDASWDDSFEDFWSVDNQTADDKSQLDFDTDDDGVAVALLDPGQAPTLTSKKYLFFGKVSAELRGAPGKGVVTALVLKSDSGDEIDWVSCTCASICASKSNLKAHDADVPAIRKSWGHTRGRHRQITSLTARPCTTLTTRHTTLTSRFTRASTNTLWNGPILSWSSPSMMRS